LAAVALQIPLVTTHLLQAPQLLKALQVLEQIRLNPMAVVKEQETIHQLMEATVEVVVGDEAPAQGPV
jgi:hypothetical protein